MTNEIVVDGDDAQRVYEVSYLLLPSIPEDSITSEVLRIKECISKNGGKILLEGGPEFRQLAYEMIKKIDSKNERFNDAYFGWIKFEGTAETAVALKKDVDADKSIIRSLIIKSAKESSHNPRPTQQPKAADESKVDEAISAEKIDEDLDKSIDELVKE